MPVWGALAGRAFESQSVKGFIKSILIVLIMAIALRQCSRAHSKQSSFFDVKLCVR